MKIIDLCVFEQEQLMFLSFSVTNNEGKNGLNELFKELSGYAISKDKEGWCDIDRNFDVRLDDMNNKIEVREKNNPPGPYGHACVLKMVPAYLLQKNMIDREQMAKLENTIELSAPVVARTQKEHQPDYMHERAAAGGPNP